MPYFSRATCAIAFMLASMGCFAAMNVIIRLLSADVPPPQMVCLRNVFSVAIVLAISALMRKPIASFKTQRLSGHLWRGGVGFCAMSLWFYSITIMPLTLATAISFITPVFSTVIAILFLGETAGVHRWGAIITGFVGVLIILRPDIGVIDPAALFVFASSLLMAVAGTVVKSLTRTESPETIVLYMSVIMTLLSIPVAVPFWQPVDRYHLFLSFWIALFSTGAHLMLARAYMRADVVVLMPFDFTRLLFTAILAYIFFGETLDHATLAGSLVIVASTVYIAHREARLNRESTQIDVS